MSLKYKDVPHNVCKPRYERLITIALLSTMAVLGIVMFAMLNFVEHYYAKPIDGPSMQPGINLYEDGPHGDIAIVSYNTNYDYGDIIIANMENSNVIEADLKTKLLIKRIIAKSGDCVDIRYDVDGYYVFLKKQGESEFTKLVEDYINPMSSFTKYNEFNNQLEWVDRIEKNPDGSITIPEGCYFALGDNRDESLDCRYFGPLPDETCMGIVAKVLKRGDVWNTIFNWLASLVS